MFVFGTFLNFSCISEMKFRYNAEVFIRKKQMKVKKAINRNASSEFI